MGKVFKVGYPILFSHCDPAGIVYFPKFFDLLHTAIEDWFTFGMSERFADFIMKKQMGTPTVSTHCDFLSPARFGDTLAIELRVLKLGKSSIELQFDAAVEGRPCLKCIHTLCIFSRETHKALPIPDDLRERMNEYLVSPL
jgi:4-hydroxybenzoyl-CoA thioesterase